MSTNYFGLDLLWFIGVVEDRVDPLKIGRCKVRCLGFHSENIELLPVENLPWAQLLIPPNSDYEVKPPKEGSWVIGFFKDGKKCQEPMILSIIPGIPITPAFEGSQNLSEQIVSETWNYKDKLKNSIERGSAPNFSGFFDLGNDALTRPIPPKNLILNSNDKKVKIVENGWDYYPPSLKIEGTKSEDIPFMKNILEEPDSSRIARNDTIDKTLIQKRIDWLQKNIPKALLDDPWDEPETKYDAQYPYNNVQQTESGHIFEIDDTRGKERISQQHRSGTFYEIHPDGTKVEKVVNKNVKIVHGDEHVLNIGELQICIKSKKGELIEDNYYIEVKKETKLTSTDNIHLDSLTGIIHLNKDRN